MSKVANQRTFHTIMFKGNPLNYIGPGDVDESQDRLTCLFRVWRIVCAEGVLAVHPFGTWDRSWRSLPLEICEVARVEIKRDQWPYEVVIHVRDGRMVTIPEDVCSTAEGMIAPSRDDLSEEAQIAYTAEVRHAGCRPRMLEGFRSITHIMFLAYDVPPAFLRKVWFAPPSAAEAEIMRQAIAKESPRNSSKADVSARNRKNALARRPVQDEDDRRKIKESYLSKVRIGGYLKKPAAEAVAKLCRFQLARDNILGLSQSYRLSYEQVQRIAGDRK